MRRAMVMLFVDYYVSFSDISAGTKTLRVATNTSTKNSMRGAFNPMNKIKEVSLVFRPRATDIWKLKEITAGVCLRRLRDPVISPRRRSHHPAAAAAAADAAYAPPLPPAPRHRRNP